MTYGNLKSEIDNSPVLPMFHTIQNNISSSGDDFMQTSITLNNEQILATDTPYIIIPATEVLGYSGSPTQIPIPIHVTICLNSLAGAYSDMEDTMIQWVIAWGSDWSDGIMNVRAGSMGNTGKHFYVPNYITEMTATPTSIDPATHRHFINSFMQGFSVEGNLQDNALAVVLTNPTPLTGGHASNIAKIDVLYYIHTLP